MSETNERSVASTGSVAGEPVAWALRWDGDSEIDAEFVYKSHANAHAISTDESFARSSVVPLYERPQPALTDAEREAVRFSSELARMGERPDLQATLHGLLERTK